MDLASCERTFPPGERRHCPSPASSMRGAPATIGHVECPEHHPSRMNVVMPAEGRGAASQAPRSLPVQAGNAMSVQSQQELREKVTRVWT